MKNIHRFLALLLALGMTAGFPCSARAEEEAPASGEPVRAVVIFEEGAGEMEDVLAALPGTEVLWTYDAFFSGAAVEAPESVLRALEDAQGVKSVGRSRAHSRSVDGEKPLAATNSLPVMAAGDPAYSGDGMVIAVLDDSLRVTHEAFGDYGQVKNPALSKADVAAFAAGGGTPGRWVSDKVPFVYDYAGKDTDVSVQVSHGTHVAALAAGYAEGEDGEVTFTGAAPAAQLVFMKVFTEGRNSMADDTVILRAMEDAYELGADVLNLSLGTDNGFTEDDILEEVYGDIFLRLEEEGVLVFCAAGNTGTPVAEKAGGVPLPSTAYTDYGSAGSPGTYSGAVSVAAADAMERESTGGVEAGGKRWAFVDSEPEEGMTAPSLDTLADRELRYIAVGGVGRAEDYDGLDAAGAVALVERGEITFTEKTLNAAAAGAVACLVYNNTAGAIIPSVEDLPVPCAVISQEAGSALLKLAEEGSGALVVRDDACMETIHEEPAMYEYSSWGTTSDLRMVPMLTAPGGSILSAGGDGDSAYEYMSGTSMASPNASGAAAGVLQALRERDPALTRAQRGKLALDLLESTAALIRDADSGVPVSPRRQGAGLINQEAAVNADVVVEEPLLELGESGAGSFTAAFRVRNLTEEALELTVGTQVLTDGWVEENGKTYSTLTPMDITGRVTVTGPETVSLPAGGSREVTLTLQVAPEARQALGEVFPNGFFVEGYITLSHGDAVPVHAAFLGYCGDWQAAPILEQVTNREVLNFQAETGGEEDWGEALGVELAANLAYRDGGSGAFDPENISLLGENLWGYAPYRQEYGALSTDGTGDFWGDGGALVVEPTLLRNAAHLIMVVRNRETGEIYKADDTPWLPRTMIEAGEAISSGKFIWSGKDGEGGPLPEGTTAWVEFYAWLDSDGEMQAAYDANAGDGDYSWLTEESYGERLEWSFPVTIDRTAPEVQAAADAGDAWSGAEVIELGRTLPEEGGQTLELALRDEQYLACAVAYGDGEEPLAELLFAPEDAGKTYVLRLGFDGPEALPEHLCVMALDYAGNATGLEFDPEALARGEAAEPEECPAAMLTDVAAGAWYHEAVDYMFSRGFMEGEDFAFRPGEAASRVEFLDALHRAAGQPLAEIYLPFFDVPKNAWYRGTVEWAYDAGIIGGFDISTFGPLAPLTRQQLAVILYRYAALEEPVSSQEVDLGAFADGDQVASWAQGAVCWAVGEGILSGDAGGRLNPESHATRGEVAAILMRYLED